MTVPRPDDRERRRRPAAVPGLLLLAHFGIALLFVLDFVLFQAAATAVTAAIYAVIPMLDDSIVRDSPAWTWIRIFQIVSPTITLPGGIVTVLSSYYFARRAQEETRRADAEAHRADAEAQKAEAEAQKAQDEARRAEAEAQKSQQETQRANAAEAQVQILQAQLAQAQAAPRSRRRRRLRNGNGAATQ